MERAWPFVDFLNQVLLVLTVLADFFEKAKIMKECMYEADLIKSKVTTNVQFTTESEAVAIYSIFMIMDCGGGTVDLTIGRRSVGRDYQKTVEMDRSDARNDDFAGSTMIARWKTGSYRLNEIS
ncbi:hypothetical protein C2G38_2192894 [Gigaspora rosea]|uniref:Uncharacterized protein n=1 Tax=Gigaspora rosea TaxID=44941 RepID=A0A397V2I3_9GLOM|nr:hypothetical protein C2G38_2192894 [Gigaspora rosea]